MKFDNYIDSIKENLIKSTQEIIRIKSVEDLTNPHFPFGKGVQDSLEYALNLSANLGFKTKNVDNYAGYAEIGNGAEMIGVLVHLDVVPEGDGWTYDPYGGVIANEKIYGRGTSDDKGPAIACLYAMKSILDSGINLNKRIRIIFGTNEETNWNGIKYYMEKEEIPTCGFTPDAEFPAIHGEKGILKLVFENNFNNKIDDGGIEIKKLSGGLRSNMVPEYAFCELTSNKDFESIVNAYNKDFNSNITFKNLDENKYILKSYGISSHGSMPEKGINAISHLICLLSHLDLQIGDLSNFIRFTAKKINTECNGESIGCNFSDLESGKLTFNLGTIELNEFSGTYEVDIRYPVTVKMNDVISGIEKELEDSNGISLKIESHQNPIYIPKTDPLVITLMNVYRDYTNDSSDPITIGGGTYARASKNIVAFGPVFPGMPELAHQKDEYVEISELILSTKIFASAMYQLAK